jgi:hypothetical protein
MLATEGCFRDVSIKMLNRIHEVSPNVQILLFSSTFSDRMREYCNKARPGACTLLGNHPVALLHSKHQCSRSYTRPLPLSRPTCRPDELNFVLQHG